MGLGAGCVHPATLFQDTDHERLAALVAARGFAVLIATEVERPVVSHAPVLLAGERLRFHLSAMSALCPVLRANPHLMAVITGPDAYVSPDWYEGADQVPTWNYLSAEIEGPVRILSRDDTAGLLDDLAAQVEARLAPKAPWSRAKMNPAKFEAMLGAIVGFEMRVERLAGVRKLSQNKSAAEIARVSRALAGQDDPGARALARLMEAEGEG